MSKYCRNLNYWDSVSTLAGEVANPHRTFPLALMLAVILVILMYVLPLLACLGVMTDVADWKLGFFATVARQVGGNWLAWWMLAAAAVSQLFSLSLCCCFCLLSVMLLYCSGLRGSLLAAAAVASRLYGQIVGLVRYQYSSGMAR